MTFVSLCLGILIVMLQLKQTTIAAFFCLNTKQDGVIMLRAFV